LIFRSVSAMTDEYVVSKSYALVRQHQAGLLDICSGRPNVNSGATSSRVTTTVQELNSVWKKIQQAALLLQPDTS